MDRLELIKNYFKSIPKRYYYYLAAGVSFLLVIIGIALVIVLYKRQSLLDQVLEKAKRKAKTEYSLLLTVKDASFSGLRSVQLEQVDLTPMGGDTLAQIERLEVTVKILPLITGKLKLADVGIDNASITFVKKDSLSNYDFLFRSDSLVSVPEVERVREDTSKNLQLGQLAERMLNNVLYKIPDNLRLRNVSVSYEDDSLFREVLIPRADMDDGALNSDLQIDRGKSLWHVTGDLHPGKKELFFRVTAENGPVVLPLIEQKYGLAVSFDTLETHLKRVERQGRDALRMQGSWKVSNLTINHWRIASNDVKVPHAYMDAIVKIGNNFISLEKESKIKIADLVAFPHAKLQILPHKTYALGVKIPEMPAQKAFDAFPKGLFTSLTNMKVSGEIGYTFDLFMDETEPDSVRLFSEMKEEGFKITAWGETDLSKINERFVYTPVEEERPVRNIIVGPENPDFTPLNEISPNLKNAVLTAEDPSFFSHEGFVPKAIKASIATNFKEKAFKRGGSTISMQLVKNVFLKREKTLARKVEEMLIVWLMEHNNIVTKERMFEVYLNIIEWGNNVYGIGEAARYYFLKDPGQLDVGESIFLASIVPRPKSGLYRFDANGVLKGFLRGYYRLIGGLMARRGLIPQDSTQSYGYYSVTLRNAVRPEPAKVDTLQSPIMDMEKELEEAKKLLEDLFSLETEP